MNLRATDTCVQSASSMEVDGAGPLSPLFVESHGGY